MQKYMGGFRQLLAWQKAHALTLDIYRTTQSFPKEERYGVTDQIRRAASSIAAQLAEGSQMNTPAHRKLYYDRAFASAAEVDSFLELAHDLKYIDDKRYNSLLESINKTAMFIKHLSSSTQSTHRTHVTQHTQNTPHPQHTPVTQNTPRPQRTQSTQHPR